MAKKKKMLRQITQQILTGAASGIIAGIVLEFLKKLIS